MPSCSDINSLVFFAWFLLLCHFFLKRYILCPFFAVLSRFLSNAAFVAEKRNHLHIILPIKSSLFSFKIKDFFNISSINISEERAIGLDISCIWYENSWFWVHEVKRLSFGSTWPCVYPSIYGSEPPVSTRIISPQLYRKLLPEINYKKAGFPTFLSIL